MLSILKVVLFESLAGNDFSERGTQAEAHCERNLNSANCEVLDEKHRMIDVQGIFVLSVGIIIKASGATLKVTDLIKGELQSVFVIFFFVLPIAFQSDNVYMDF